jgi:GNAT superfamily N-acetyltransferase
MRDLAVLIEANNFERIRLYGRNTPGVELYDGPDLLRLTSETFTRIPWANFPQVEADARVATILAALRPQGLDIVWQVGPASRPRNLGERLLAHDMALLQPGDAGMALELDRLREDVAHHPTVAIRRASSAADVELFEALQAEGFERRPPPRPSPMLRFFEALGWGSPDLDRVRAYIGSVMGKPVATASAHYGAGVVGLYGVATLPAYRRQGLATALMLHALRAARAEGISIATLYASEMGQEVYRRLGFRQYCIVERYVWSAGT